MTNEREIAVVVGVGPGLGAALARRFARAGHDLALIARSSAKLEAVRKSIENEGGRALALTADASDAASMATAFARIRDTLGAPSVLVYNAGVYRIAGLLEISPDDFEASWKANCHGAFLAAREVVPAMLEQRRGTILFSGATGSIRGGARFSCLAVGKFGLRALAQSMARELGPSGIHVAHVIIDGQIDTPRIRELFPGRDASTLISPDAIAELYWQLHAQSPDCWTHEIDIRPSVEKF